MLQSTLENSLHTKPAMQSIEYWANLHAIVMLISAALAFFTHQLAPLLIGAFLSFGLLCLTQKHSSGGYMMLAGWANRITTIRVLLIMLALLLYQQLMMEWLFILFTLAVLLDVIDGKVARKQNQVSVFGQYFDMEGDAFFVLAMGFYFLHSSGFGAWLLIPGLLRYFYRLVLGPGSVLCSASNFVESRKSYAAFLAGLNFLLLLAAIPLEAAVQFWLLAISCVVVSLSFAISFFEYGHHVLQHR